MAGKLVSDERLSSVEPWKCPDVGRAHPALAKGRLRSDTYCHAAKLPIFLVLPRINPCARCALAHTETVGLDATTCPRGAEAMPRLMRALADAPEGRAERPPESR